MTSRPLKSPHSRVLAVKNEKILEKSEEHDKSSKEDDSDTLGISQENNTMKNDMKKYSNAIGFPSLLRFTSPRQAATPNKTVNKGPQPTVKKAQFVQGTLLKMLNPEIPEMKNNTVLTPRQQSKRQPLMNFLKPFH